MNKDILQKFVQFNGDYLLGQKYTKSFRGSNEDTLEAILLTPDVDREYLVEDIGKLPFDSIEKFANQEIKTIIHLGKEYGPFQYGTQRKDFITLEKITCPAMDLVVRCYNEKITDYHKAIEIMKELTPTTNEVPK